MRKRSHDFRAATDVAKPVREFRPQPITKRYWAYSPIVVIGGERHLLPEQKFGYLRVMFL